MPTVQRRFDPDKISDKMESRFPLRLVRLCIQELWKVIETPSLIFGGTGGSGSGTGPASTLATRVQVRWVANGPYRVDTSVDGAWIVPTACEIAKVYLWRRVAGTAGSTILDLNRNGSSLYFTQGNRPTLIYSDADGLTACSLPDVVSLVAGDIVTVDCDAKDTGRPTDYVLMLEAA